MIQGGLKRAFLFLVAGLILALDQATKEWVRANLPASQSLPPDGLIRLTHTTNTGSAFGLFPDQGTLLALVAVVVIGVILIYQRHLGQDALLLKGSLGLQLGGAIGNLLDRVRLGHVTDFVDLRVWPVFNVADSAIVVGVGLLAYLFLVVAKKEPPLG